MANLALRIFNIKFVAFLSQILDKWLINAKWLLSLRCNPTENLLPVGGCLVTQMFPLSGNRQNSSVRGERV